MPNSQILSQFEKTTSLFEYLKKQRSANAFPEILSNEILSELNLVSILSREIFHLNTFISEKLLIELLDWFEEMNNFLSSIVINQNLENNIVEQAKRYRDFKFQVENLYKTIKTSSDKKLVEELIKINNEEITKRIAPDLKVEELENKLKNQQLRFQETIETYNKRITDILNKGKSDSLIIEGLKDGLSKEIQDLKESYKLDISQFELFKQQKEFSDTADNIKRNLKFWRNSIVLLSVLLLLVALCFLNVDWLDFTYLKSNGLTEKTQLSIFYIDIFKRFFLRFFMLGIIIILLKFSIKNYNLCMHNITINLHKANCFGAAFKIIASIENETTKQEILKQAGREIFSHHSTGYITDGNSKVDLSLIEKITSIIKKSSN